MSHKRKGQLTVSGEWAKHLRPLLRRAFWKGDRQAGKHLIREEKDKPAPTEELANENAVRRPEKKK